MNCCENNKTPDTRSECGCMNDILDVILKLQKRGEKIDNISDSCDKPFLGPSSNATCYNTRPVTFYRCSDGGQWEMPYTLNGEDGTSGVFRVESLDGCCVTCRVLAPNPDTSNPLIPYVATDSFFTLNLNCVGALKCLADTYISCI